MEWSLHLSLPAAAVLVAGVNLPFGYWRSRVPRFSRAWFLAIHLPVPLVVALRVLSGLGWRFNTFTVLVGAFCAGQWLGSAAYHAVLWIRRRRLAVSSRKTLI